MLPKRGYSSKSVYSDLDLRCEPQKWIVGLHGWGSTQRCTGQPRYTVHERAVFQVNFDTFFKVAKRERLRIIL